MYEPSVGFMGAGFVGGSMIRAFSGYLRTFVYDKGKDIGDFELVIENSDVIFVSVPTPMRKSGACDTRIVEEVVMGIDQYLHKQRRGLREVIIRSTVPPLFLRELHGELTFVKLGFMPEFLTERTADLDFIMSPRFLLGSDAGRDTDLPHAHRAMQVRFPGTPIVDLSFEEASMIKYATNAFFTVKLSFFNELAQACDTLEQTYGYCDWETVRDELLQDGRVRFTLRPVDGVNDSRDERFRVRLPGEPGTGWTLRGTDARAA